MQDDDSQFTEVFFVDYGHTEFIEREFIFEIPDDIVQMELHAIRVSLAEFMNDNIDDILFGFQYTSHTFQKMVLNKIFSCRVVGGNCASQSVDLYDDEGRSIRDVMLSALSVDGANVSACFPKTISLPRAINQVINVHFILQNLVM